MYKAVYDGVLASAGSKVSFILHQVPQPWHPQGSFVHEAALAVKEVQPDAYPAYVRAIFGAYDTGKFQDTDTWTKSRAQIYEELLDILPDGVDRAVKLYPKERCSCNILCRSLASLPTHELEHLYLCQFRPGRPFGEASVR